MELRVRGVLVFLGLLLVVVGGAMAVAQYAHLDLSALDAVAGVEVFLLSPNALYAGAGAAACGLLLVVIAAATGRKKPRAPARKQAASPEKPLSAESLFDPEPTPPPLMPETPRTVIRPLAKPPQAPDAPRQGVAGSDQPPWSQLATAPSVKPTASAQPPDGYDPLIASRSDPRLLNRKRVTDLVSINDALKAYHARHDTFPKAEGLLGVVERGSAWIPGLAPEFIPQLPRDPSTANGPSAAQYVYASDGRNYKLLAQGVSLIGGTNVEVLGVRIDPTRRPTAENASFGFWTPGFASV